MIEDEIFAHALEVKGIKRTKSMYEPARHKHKCTLCADETNEVGYRLKAEFVEGTDTPYLFICNECFESLKEK